MKEHAPFTMICTLYTSSTQGYVQYIHPVHNGMYYIHIQYTTVCTIYTSSTQRYVLYTHPVHNGMYYIYIQYTTVCTIYTSSTQRYVLYLQYKYLVPYRSLNKSTLVRHLTFSPSDLYTVLSLVLTFYWCGLPFVLSELKFMETKKQN